MSKKDWVSLVDNQRIKLSFKALSSRNCNLSIDATMTTLHGSCYPENENILPKGSVHP